MKKLIRILFVFLFCILCVVVFRFVGRPGTLLCEYPAVEPEIPAAHNSVYYWKTTFSLNDAEHQFLADHHIRRIYIRYFDVGLENDIPSPLGTIRFNDTIPSGMEVIPTVFIDNDLFKNHKMSDYMHKIVDRILTMSATNDILHIPEVQIDCDWTKSTERSYFLFLDSMRKELRKHDIGLSTTIRLHQLRMEAPPADRGVLMCYNTGAVLNRQTENSILRAADVKPYAEGLADYPLRLDIAYPAFSWGVWFRDGTFKALLRGAIPYHESLEHTEENIYRVKRGFYQEGHYFAYDDEIRFEESSIEEIFRCKELLEPQLHSHSVIIYHLDSYHLSKYTTDEIRKIYNN